MILVTNIYITPVGIRKILVSVIYYDAFINCPLRLEYVNHYGIATFREITCSRPVNVIM